MAGHAQSNSPSPGSSSPSHLSSAPSPAPLASLQDTSPPCPPDISQPAQSPSADESTQKHSVMGSYHQVGVSLHPQYQQDHNLSSRFVPDSTSDNFSMAMAANATNIRNMDVASPMLNYDVTNPIRRAQRPAQQSRLATGTAMGRPMAHPQNTHPMQSDQDSMAIELYRNPGGTAFAHFPVMDSDDQPHAARHEPVIHENAYAYCYDRGNGEYTRLVPVDMLPPLRDIPATQSSISGMMVVPQPRGAPPNGPSSNTERIFLQLWLTILNQQAGSPTQLGDIQSHIDGILNDPLSQTLMVRQGRHAAAPRPSQKKDKVYCDKWVHEGICAFTQQGCRYKHEMPSDKATLQSLGLCNGFPAWWKKKLAEESKQRCDPPRPIRTIVQDGHQSPNMSVNPYTRTSVPQPSPTTLSHFPTSPNVAFGNNMSPSATCSPRYQAQDIADNLNARGIPRSQRQKQFPTETTRTARSNTPFTAKPNDNGNRNGSTGTPQFQRGYPLYIQHPREYNLSEMGEGGGTGSGVSLASTTSSSLLSPKDNREESETSSNSSSATTIRGGLNISQPFSSSFGATFGTASLAAGTATPATNDSSSSDESKENRSPTASTTSIPPIARPARFGGGGLENSRHRSGGGGITPYPSPPRNGGRGGGGQAPASGSPAFRTANGSPRTVPGPPTRDPDGNNSSHLSQSQFAGPNVLRFMDQRQQGGGGYGRRS